MPSRDETGRRLSGAEQAKMKLAHREERRRAEKSASEAETGQCPGLDFSQLAPPPLNDPIAAMVWWNDVLLVCADKVMRDSQMPLEQKIRFLMDGSAKAGMIRDKAAESKAIQQAMRKLDEDKIAHGLEPNEHRPKPPPVPRPVRRSWSGSG